MPCQGSVNMIVRATGICFFDHAGKAGVDSYGRTAGLCDKQFLISNNPPFFDYFISIIC